MNIYSNKQRWKFVLAIMATIIVLVSLWYTNVLVRQIAEGEKEQVQSWANAIQKKAELVHTTQDLFDKIAAEERKRVEIWAEANRRVAISPLDEDPAFYTTILFSNTTIPMILTTEDGEIITSANLNPQFINDTSYIQNQLAEMKEKDQVVEINYFENQKNLLYYNESTIFSELSMAVTRLARCARSRTPARCRRPSPRTCDSTAEAGPRPARGAVRRPDPAGGR